MKIQIQNLLDGDVETFRGDERTVYAAVAAKYPMQAQEADGNLMALVAAIRRIQHLDARVAPEPAEVEAPWEARDRKAATADIDEAKDLKVVIETLGSKKKEYVEGSGEDVLAELKHRFPDYEAATRGKGLVALIDYINTNHPTVSVSYGDELQKPRFKREKDLLNHDGRDDRPGAPDLGPAYKSPPYEPELGHIEGESDDQDYID